MVEEPGSNMERKIKMNYKDGNNESSIANSSNSEINLIQMKLEHFRANILKDVDNRLSGMIDEVLQEISQHELRAHEFRAFTKTHQQYASTWINRATVVDSPPNALISNTDMPDKNRGANEIQCPETSEAEANTTSDISKTKKLHRSLPDKVFVARQSYLTALLEVDHMKTIYNIFQCILITLLLNCISHDYFVEGRINFGFGTFRKGFAKLHLVLGTWLMEHVFVFGLYYAFTGWATIRAKLSRQQALQRFWSHSCLIVYISSQLLFCVVGSSLCLKLDLPFVTASVLLLETTRLLMKMHSFVRYNCSRVIEGKLKSDDDQTQLQAKVPQFHCYLYFLFAPTLLYRDTYPRTSHIRWKFALARFFEVVAIAFIYSYLYERYIKVHFHNYGLVEMNASALIMKYFGMTMPSAIILLCGFYMLLHSWLNFTGELLRFGDRMFYKDWWTQSTYEGYYRNWNVVVHDWLYEYIYKDCYTYLFKGSKVAASLTVFMVSALVHEQLLGFALQIFFPIMFMSFGILGVAFVFITRKAPKSIGNIFLWSTLILGNTVNVSLYSMEYYARLNCPMAYNGTLKDYIIPAVWSCYHR